MSSFCQPPRAVLIVNRPVVPYGSRVHDSVVIDFGYRRDVIGAGVMYLHSVLVSCTEAKTRFRRVLVCVARRSGGSSQMLLLKSSPSYWRRKTQTCVAPSTSYIRHCDVFMVRWRAPTGRVSHFACEQQCVRIAALAPRSTNGRTPSELRQLQDNPARPHAQVDNTIRLRATRGESIRNETWQSVHSRAKQRHARIGRRIPTKGTRQQEERASHNLPSTSRSTRFR